MRWLRFLLFRHFFCCIEKLSMRANAAAHGNVCKVPQSFCSRPKSSEQNPNRQIRLLHSYEKRAESCSFLFIEVHAVNRFELADGWRWESAASISSIHSTSYATHNNKSSEASKCTHAHATAPSIQFSCEKSVLRINCVRYVAHCDMNDRRRECECVRV